MSRAGEVTMQVPFHDIDILGIVWHGHYYKYFELARTELYRNHGLDIEQMHAMGYVFPVIESQCRYVHALKYGQRIRIRAVFDGLVGYVKIAYTIFDDESGERMAYGHTKQAICTSDGTMLLAVPDEVMDAIGD